MNDVIKYAYNIGYRLFDTAQMSHNEDALGNAIQANLIDRNDIFLISKVDNSNQGYKNTITSFYDSLSKLKTDYLDEVNTIPLKLIKVISIERTIIDSIKRIDLAGGIEDLLIALDTVYSLNEDVLFKVLKHYNEVYLYQKVAYLLSLFKEKLHISENFFNECKSHFTNQIKYFLNESIENIVYFKEWKLMASKDLKKC